MIGETRESPGGGLMGVEQIERELGQLRMNEDGTLGLRASVLNLIVVTDEESAGDVIQSFDGVALSDANAALEAYGKLDRAAQVQVAVSRRGAPVTLTYRLR